MDKNNSQEALVKLICKAFSGDYPNNKEICFTLSGDTRYEGNIIFNCLNLKPWDSLVNDDFSLLREIFLKVRTFTYFTPIGFTYYLPAFLIYVSQYKDEEFMERLFYRLQPGSRQSQMESFSEIFLLFNDQEALAIKDALNILDNIWSSWGVVDNWAKAALENYWNYI